MAIRPNSKRSETACGRRMDLGLCQKDAVLLGLTEDSVCYWENNRVTHAVSLRSGSKPFSSVTHGEVSGEKSRR